MSPPATHSASTSAPLKKPREAEPEMEVPAVESIASKTGETGNGKVDGDEALDEVDSTPVATPREVLVKSTIKSSYTGRHTSSSVSRPLIETKHTIILPNVAHG